MNIFAYLDPSTGSLFVQALIGSIAGAGFLLRRFITRFVQRIVSFRSGSLETSKNE